MSKMNRLGNAKNPFQGTAKKVLCVCSAGLLRSPTLAKVLSQEPFNYNTRAVGTSKEYALIPLDDVLMHWADEIVFVNMENYKQAIMYHSSSLRDRQVKVLDIPDNYPYGDPELMSIIVEQYNKHNNHYYRLGPKDPVTNVEVYKIETEKTVDSDSKD